MKRRSFQRSISAMAGGVAETDAVGAETTRRTSSGLPNLIYVFADQMRGQALGFLGEDPVVTPCLDRFAAESLVLPQAVSNYPVCSPCRAIFMTGKYPHANGVLANCTSRTAAMGNELCASDRCWSDILKEAGYDLGYIGKWHLDGPREPYIDCANNHGELKWNEWCPPERRHGFDSWYAYGTYDEHLRPLYWEGHAPREGFHYVDQWGPEHEADKAVEYIRNPGDTLRDPDKPFALVVSMNPPHTPYAAHPDSYDAFYEGQKAEDLCRCPNIPGADTRWGAYYRKHIRDYFASVTGVDDQFGRIVRAVDEAGLSDNSIVVFTSDHGDCLGIHEMVSKNNCYEESMRVPFLVRWPGKIAPRRDELLLSTPDIYPTLLDLMGCGNRIPKDLHGQSHAGLFLTGEGERPVSQPYLWVPEGQPSWGRRGMRTRRHTLEVTRMPNGPDRTLLHDRREDPYQLENTAEEQPEVVDRLTREELRPWLERVGDPWIERLG